MGADFHHFDDNTHGQHQVVGEHDCYDVFVVVKYLFGEPDRMPEA